MLVIFQPAGSDQFLAELARTSGTDFEGRAGMKALEDNCDIVKNGFAPGRKVPGT